MDNMYSTIGENMPYFMYKYIFNTNDWYRPLSFLNNKIDIYVNSTVNFDIVCILLLRLNSYVRLEIWVTHNSFRWHYVNNNISILCGFFLLCFCVLYPCDGSSFISQTY